MRQLLDKIEAYLKTLSKRDRIAMVVIVFVVLIFLWDALLRAPLAEARVVIEHDLMQVENELVVIQAKIKAVQTTMVADSDANAKDELAQFIDENKRLDVALKKTSVQIINPQEMTGMLEQILVSQSELKFVSLKNMPATPEFIESPTDVGASGGAASDGVTATRVENLNTIYRHSVILEMEGSYHNLLSYLKILEQFPWRFFWQGIEIETDKYPNMLIKLEVYTLGFREGIIGV